MNRETRLELLRVSAELTQAKADLSAVRASSSHRHPASTTYVDPVTGQTAILLGRPLLDICGPGCPMEPEQTHLFRLVDALSSRLRALKHESAQADIDLAKIRGGRLAAQGTAARQRKASNRRKKVKAKALKGKGAMPAKVFAADPAKTRTAQRDLRAIRGPKAR